MFQWLRKLLGRSQRDARVEPVGLFERELKQATDIRDGLVAMQANTRASRRCTSRKREGSRTWRCQSETPGHDEHFNVGGGRRWR